MMKYNFLKKISSSEFEIWDVKRYFTLTLNYNSKYKVVKFKEVLEELKIMWEEIENEKTYKILGVSSYGKGVFVSRTSKGKDLVMKKYQKSQSNCLYWCKVDTKNGAFGIVTEEFEKTYGSPNMTYLKINTNKINREYLQLLFKIEEINQYMDNMVVGVTNRKYINKNQLLNEVKIPLPTLEEQAKIVCSYKNDEYKIKKLEKEIVELEEFIKNKLNEKLGIEKTKIKKRKGYLENIKYSSMKSWSVDKQNIEVPYLYNKLNPISYNESLIIFENIFRGKSPKYSEVGKEIILNQKCNRWDKIEIKYAKKVDEKWFQNIGKEYFTKIGDVIVNSTGEGTIGRASLIRKGNEELIYDSHVLLIRLNKKIIFPEFFIILFNSEYIQEQITLLKGANATKQTELGVTNIQKIKFLIPTMNEQVEIFKEIKVLKEKIEKNKMEIKMLEEQKVRNLKKEILL